MLLSLKVGAVGWWCTGNITAVQNNRSNTEKQETDKEMDTNFNSQERHDELLPLSNQAYDDFGTGTTGEPSGGLPSAPYSPSGPLPKSNRIEIPRTPASTAHAGAGPQKPGKKRNGFVALMLSAMLMLGMLLGGAGAGAVMLVTGNASALTAGASAQGGTATATPSASASNAASAELVAQTNQATINSIYKTVSPSVVMITSAITTNGRFRATGEATGTGIVIDKQGHILTNYHVIQGATSIKVQFSDGSEYTATVAGTAPQNDLAVITAGVPGDKLVPAALGDSSTVQVGDEVIAIGYPYALDLSVTSGIVSGLDRDGSSSGNGASALPELTGLIQVDAAINPGNSGGPLLNAKGQVIGVNTMIESPVDGFTGVGLAIPINQVKALLSQLEQGGSSN
jgi:putative serine protease PepD